jgi:Eukaryotic cytochrome b561
MRILLLTALFTLSAASPSPTWCHFGTWQDQNGECHLGSPPGDPIGWVDRNDNRVHPYNSPFTLPTSSPCPGNQCVFTLPDGTKITIGDKRYSITNNPATFFDARWSDYRDIQPYRDVPGGVPYLSGMNWDFARKMRLAHGWLSSVAFVVLFPLGAIIVNVAQGGFGKGAHIVLQVLGWLLYLVGAAAGLWMATVIRWRNFSFVSTFRCVRRILTNQFPNYHVIIGLLLFLLLLIQPLFGLIALLRSRKHKRRGISGLLHAWLGRGIVILGMINGGLGLLIAGNATRREIVAYSIIASIIFVFWVLAAMLGALKRHRKDVPRKPKARRGEKGPTMNGARR